MAAILDAILNISISPMMPRWHHSVPIYGHIGEHIYAKTFCADYFFGLHPKSSFCNRTIYIVACFLFVLFFTTTVGANWLFCWLVVKGFNGPLTKNFSLYRPTSHREGETRERTGEIKTSEQPIPHLMHYSRQIRPTIIYVSRKHPH